MSVQTKLTDMELMKGPPKNDAHVWELQEQERARKQAAGMVGSKPKGSGTPGKRTPSRPKQTKSVYFSEEAEEEDLEGRADNLEELQEVDEAKERRLAALEEEQGGHLL